jgi:hypothetical protein
MVLVTFAGTKVTRVRADARIEIKTSRSDTDEKQQPPYLHMGKATGVRLTP